MKRIGKQYQILCEVVTAAADGEPVFTANIANIQRLLFEHAVEYVTKYFRDRDVIRAALRDLEVYQVAGELPGEWSISSSLEKSRTAQGKEYLFTFRRSG